MSLSRLPLCVVCRSFVIIRSNSTYSTYSHHTSVGQFWAHKPAQIVASLNLIGCTNCATFCKCIYVWFLQRALWAQKLASIITPTEGCADPCTIWVKNLELTATYVRPWTFVWDDRIIWMNGGMEASWLWGVLVCIIPVVWWCLKRTFCAIANQQIQKGPYVWWPCWSWTTYSLQHARLRPQGRRV